MGTTVETRSGPAIVMPGSHAACFGVTDLSLRRRDGKWTCTGSRTELRLPDAHARSSPDAPAIDLTESDLHQAHRDSLSALRRVVAPNDRDLHAHFALVGKCDAAGLVAAAKLDALSEWAGANGMSDRKLVVAVSPYRSTGTNAREWPLDIGPGNVLERHVFSIYPYRNQLAVMELTAQDLRAWLERSASVYRQLRPGTRPAERLYDYAMPSHHFDILFGISYTVDPTEPALYHPRTGALIAGAGGRIRDMSVEGRPVSDSDRFLVGTADFRAVGGGNFPHVAQSVTVHHTGQLCRDILRAHLRHGGGIARSDWRFASDADVECLIDLHPKARAHLDAINHLSPQVIEDGADRMTVALRLCSPDAAHMRTA